jgi:hypothetical protein
MTVELHPDDQKVLEEDWKSYAGERTETGLQDVKAARTVPAEEIYRMLRR